jgi:hypothetical protein
MNNQMNGCGNSKFELLWTWLNNNNNDYGDVKNNGRMVKLGVSKNTHKIKKVCDYDGGICLTNFRASS